MRKGDQQPMGRGCLLLLVLALVLVPMLLMARPALMGVGILCVAPRVELVEVGMAGLRRDEVQVPARSTVRVKPG